MAKVIVDNRSYEGKYIIIADGRITVDDEYAGTVYGKVPVEVVSGVEFYDGENIIIRDKR